MWWVVWDFSRTKTYCSVLWQIWAWEIPVVWRVADGRDFVWWEVTCKTPQECLENKFYSVPSLFPAIWALKYFDDIKALKELKKLEELKYLQDIENLIKNLNRLEDWEIRMLQRQWIDIHKLKPKVWWSKFDLYKDKTNWEIYYMRKPQYWKSIPESVDLNLNNYK
jgi:hypothetical protein